MSQKIFIKDEYTSEVQDTDTGEVKMVLKNTPLFTIDCNMEPIKLELEGAAEIRELD